MYRSGNSPAAPTRLPWTNASATPDIATAQIVT
uniref:Uncharacterized protein n=1 Tax=Rhizophora mucronata TaxID=61149 RepID=A0A2P2P6R2_RHIMU